MKHGLSADGKESQKSVTLEISNQSQQFAGKISFAETPLGFIRVRSVFHPWL
jgi:hypothetical protein